MRMPLLVVLSGCAGGSLEAPAPVSATLEEGWVGDDEADRAPEPSADAPARQMEAEERKRSAPGRAGLMMEPVLEDVTAARPSGAKDDEPAPADNKPQAGEASEERTRAWFPESFLWQPLVHTDASGTATVPLTVPDQLTTWRVLALAHDRSGGQAGSVHTFDSSLPAYVDPVLPGWLYAGDRIALPVQVVNNGAEALAGTLTVEANGAWSGGGTAAVGLAGWDSDVRTIPLQAEGAGTGRLAVRLAGTDAAVREVPVAPSGRPEERTRGGTLAGPRSFRLPGPEDSDPRTERLQVLVFPGALAVLQAEILRVSSGGAPWEGGYGFALSRHLGALSAAAGLEVDADAARALRIKSWQRVVRRARAPDAGIAADLLLAVGDGDSGHELLDTLRPRLARTLVEGQRADGTWARQGSAPLQQVVVQTAVAARALPEDATGARLRASGALERHARDVEDAYTASVVLASGLCDRATAERLETLLLAAVRTDSVGRRSVAVKGSVRNAWGARPTRAEVLAWATLALASRTDLDWRGDLVADLLSGWSATWGFGGGPADVIALDAIATALPALQDRAKVVLSVDGTDVGSAELDPTQPHVPAVLEASTSASNPELGLRAEPPVVGLAFVATLNAWVPWTGAEELPGVEVELELPGLRVGRPGQAVLRMVAPSGASLVVEQGLPAGATVDEAALRAQHGQQLQTSQVRTDRVLLTTRAFGAGEVMEVPLPVTPAFAGRFSTVPLKVTAAGREVQLPPEVWTVKP